MSQDGTRVLLTDIDWSNYCVPILAVNFLSTAFVTNCSREINDAQFPCFTIAADACQALGPLVTAIPVNVDLRSGSSVSS